MPHDPRWTSLVEDLKEDEQHTKVYDTWYYASMGACDLNQLNSERQPAPGQAELIRAAIEKLPGEAAERHMGMFANSLFTRLSGVKPEIKFNFLKTGFKIVGDHERAEEARKVYDYYKDLVTEIKLETVVDGFDAAGLRIEETVQDLIEPRGHTTRDGEVGIDAGLVYWNLHTAAFPAGERSARRFGREHRQSS